MLVATGGTAGAPEHGRAEQGGTGGAVAADSIVSHKYLSTTFSALAFVGSSVRLCAAREEDTVSENLRRSENVLLGGACHVMIR